MTAAEIARLRGGRRAGNGYVMRCTCHDDQNPSLSIADADDGSLLVKCFRGCPSAAIIADFRQRGWWPEKQAMGLQSGGGWIEWRDGIRYPADWGRPIRDFTYTDEIGKYLFTVVRFDEPKSFRPGYYDGDRWTWKKHPRQVLYRLPEVIESPILFVCEGERDVETLRAWGFTATTAAGGANAPWLPEYTETLRGRECIIIPDADAPGRRRAAEIARALLPVAARLSIVELPGAKDVTEWFERGHAEVELISLVEGVHAS